MPIDERRFRNRLVSGEAPAPKVKQIGLVPCPACRESVSTEATACPRCGQPLRPVVIEQSSKRVKAMILAGAGVAFVGMVGGLFSQKHVAGLPISGVVMVAGLLVGATGSFLRWWRHG